MKGSLNRSFPSPSGGIMSTQHQSATGITATVILKWTARETLKESEINTPAKVKCVVSLGSKVRVSSNT